MSAQFSIILDHFLNLKKNKKFYDTRYQKKKRIWKLLPKKNAKHEKENTSVFSLIGKKDQKEDQQNGNNSENT